MDPIRLPFVESLALLLADLTAKGTLLLLLACFASMCLRRSSAAVKHAVWSTCMASLILLPAAAWLLPEWRLPILPASATDHLASAINPKSAPVITTANDARSQSMNAARVESTAPSAANPNETFGNRGPWQPAPFSDAEAVRTPMESGRSQFHSSTPWPLSMIPALTAVSWLGLMLTIGCGLGTLFFSGVYLQGLIRVARLRRQARTVVPGPWSTLLSKITRRLSISRKVELREHSEPVVPLTCGVIRPVVLIPQQAQRWCEPMRRAVLSHELAHVKRNDVAWQMIGRLACTMFWFHPLAWFGLRQLRQLGEQASDDVVTQSGEKASEYAEQLLQVARLCSAPSPWSLGVAMAEGNHLELRIKSLFDSGRNHSPLPRSNAAVLIVLGGLSLGLIAMVQPVSLSAYGAAPPAANAGVAEPPADDAAPSPQGARLLQANESNTALRPASTTRAPANWQVGPQALDQIAALRPVFGSPHRGIKAGLAIVANQDDFRMGERIPTKLFLINVGDQPTTLNVDLDFRATPPAVTDSQGEDVLVSTSVRSVARPSATVTLKPGEACFGSVRGLGLGKHLGAPSLESPKVGGYKLRYDLGLLQTGVLEFRIAERQPRKSPRASNKSVPKSYPYYTLRGPRDFLLQNPDSLPQKWIRGQDALEDMIQLRPVFGDPHEGIRLGVAYAASQRVFALGGRIPIKLFVLNDSDREVQFEFTMDDIPSASGFLVSNIQGESLRVWNMERFGNPKRYHVRLQPGEACSGPTRLGLGLGKRLHDCCIGSPASGSYQLRFQIEKLKSGSLEFKATQSTAGALRVDTRGPDWTHGSMTRRLEILKPIFGEPKKGIEMGLAISTLRRKFAVSEHVPMELFFRNVGDQEVTFKTCPDFLWEPPTVLGPDGQAMKTSRMMTWMDRPIYELTLRPGQSKSIPTYGLGLGGPRTPSVIEASEGEYKVQFKVSIFGLTGGSHNKANAMLSSGRVAVEVSGPKK